MFTTLTTFTRAMNFENNKVLVSDTVGFINKLPAYMIDAFKSTLHELTHAILILLVLDISQAVEEIKKNMESSIEVLNELNIPLTRVIYLLNKMDLTTIYDVSDKIIQLGLLEHTDYVLPISAKKGYNIYIKETNRKTNVFRSYSKARVSLSLVVKADASIRNLVILNAVKFTCE